MRNHFQLSFLLLLPACNLQTQDNGKSEKLYHHEMYKTIAEIPAPEGFTRIKAETNSFGEWLRNIKLKKDKRVFLYNGSLKPDQSVQFAVLDEPVGNKDLQQCADACFASATECEKYALPHCTACAKACRLCEEECNSLAG